MSQQVQVEEYLEEYLQLFVTFSWSFHSLPKPERERRSRVSLQMVLTKTCFLSLFRVYKNINILLHINDKFDYLTQVTITIFISFS